MTEPAIARQRAISAAQGSAGASLLELKLVISVLLAIPGVGYLLWHTLGFAAAILAGLMLAQWPVYCGLRLAGWLPGGADSPSMMGIEPARRNAASFRKPGVSFDFSESLRRV